MADQLFAGEQLGPWWWNAIAIEAQASERAVDMAQRIDPGDGFLAEIATLLKADGARIAGDFLRQVVVGDIDAKQRRARFDPRHLHRFRAARRYSRRAEGVLNRRRIWSRCLQEE